MVFLLLINDNKQMIVNQIVRRQTTDCKSLIVRLAVSGFMVFCGAMIYLSSRETILFFDCVPESVINMLNRYRITGDSRFGYFMVYCLPDGLWYGALLLTQSALLINTFWSKCVFLISIVLPFAWELLQLFDDVAGTFDPMDLLVYIITLSIFLIWFNCYQNYHHE